MIDKSTLFLPPQIETERLLLRPYRLEDAPMYYAMSLRNRSHLMRYESGNSAMSVSTLEDAEILVQDFAAQWNDRNVFFLGAFEKSSGEFAAQIYIGPASWETPEFNLGYFADVDHEGKGYVTEAAKGAIGLIFENLQAQRVTLECDDTNTRSIRVAERCGLRREGHFRNNRRHADGSLSGTLYYGLLREEYEARKQETVS